MSLTEAMEEAYAANPAGDVIIETIELNHITFDEPVRVANGIEEDIELPTELDGDPVLFRALPVSVVLPGVTEDGPTGMKLRINDPNGELVQYLDAAVLSTDPIEITYRVYTTGDLTQPGDVITGLFLFDVDHDAQAAEGQVGFKEIELQAFPLATFNATDYPALANG